jgi:catechol 2,3-dioxygenase-like lactoylglutathione lyase family enzyme
MQILFLIDGQKNIKKLWVFLILKNNNAYDRRFEMKVKRIVADTPTPDLSIEVDDVDAAFERMKRAGFPIEYGPVDEPWGVRRFYVRDPFGKLINILAHEH